jgi:hypothetical protein
MSEELERGDTGYVCSACGLPVTPENGALVRACIHTDAPVIATMSAVVSGEGGVDNGA